MRVTVEQGDVDGLADGDVLRFRGLPYAAPPVGDMRWTPPVAPAPWSGTRQATQPAPRCPQLAAAPGTPARTAAGGTEDCLTVDVTVPAGSTASSALPVLVWLHGGAFSAGAAGDVDPRRLAAAGPVVVVTVNYRLGILGYLGLPGLAGAGTFGLLDQQAALRWVARNIAAFGGDPGQVTLGGESAGADSVCAQLVSPASAGLFRRAILQSGECGPVDVFDAIVPGSGPLGDTWKPLPLLEAAGSAAAARLGCPDPAAQLACLRRVPVARLVDGAGVYWSPATDTPTLPARPSDQVSSGGVRPVPLLVGTNRDEGTLFVADLYDHAGRPVDGSRFAAMLASAVPTRAAQAGAAYPTVGRSPGRAWSDVVTDRVYACPALAAYPGLGIGAPLYAYEFADPTAPATFVALPADLAGGTTHGAEMAYLFDLTPGQPVLTPAQQVLAAELVGRWARFVRGDDPDGPAGDGGSPAWPRWSGAGRLLAFTATGGTVVPAADVAAEHHCGLWGG